MDEVILLVLDDSRVLVFRDGVEYAYYTSAILLIDLGQRYSREFPLFGGSVYVN